MLLGAKNIWTEITAVSTLYYYIFVVALLALWGLLFIMKDKDLKNNVNAVYLRKLYDIIRASDRNTNQLDEILKIFSKQQNDLGMIFYLYCRLHKDLSCIKQYLNYKTYKQLNKKTKPWIFIAAMAAVILAVSIYGLFDKRQDILLSLLIPAGMVVYLVVFSVIAMMEFNTYWLEFINLFEEINYECEAFFETQEPYFKEFADKVLTHLSPTVIVQRQIEKIISNKVSVIEINRRAAADNSEPAVRQPIAAAPLSSTPPEQKHIPDNSKNFQESAAYLQAQTQVTQQMMQIMMQQNMQQNQLVQNAIAGQQALAQGVVQQNIMAMRIDAQRQFLKSRELSRDQQKEIEIEQPALQDVASKMDWVSKDAAVVSKAAQNGPNASQSALQNQNAGYNTLGKRDVKQNLDKSIAANNNDVKQDSAKLSQAKGKNSLEKVFVSEALPKINPSNEKILFAPERNQTNIEKRLGVIFNGKVYKYKKGDVWTSAETDVKPASAVNTAEPMTETVVFKKKSGEN